jgi:tetratricopeptide (TPR) repeat protein
VTSPRPLSLVIVLLSVVIGCKKPTPSTPVSRPSAVVDAVSLNNRGVGLMGRFEFDPARAVFADLLKSADDPDVRVNLAIATLNRQQEGDTAEALRLVDAVLAAHPEHARARYCRGILLLNGGKPAEALPAFRAVADADPADPYARYHVGQCLLATGDRPGALAEYRKAIELDPQLRSAHYGAFVCLQQMGKPDEAKPYLEEFQRLKDNPRARLVEFKYSRMGPKAEVATIGPAAVPPAPRPAGPLFADAAPLPITNAAGLAWRTTVTAGEIAPSITVADIDGDGRPDLFIAGAFAPAGPARNAVLLRRGNSFELAPNHPLAGVADVNAVLWGDFDNDGLTDVYLCRRDANQLWRQTKPGEWQDVTASTKTAGGDFDTVDGAFVDADHDGDLDLVLIRRNGPTELLSNNLDGTFRAIGQQSGLAGDGREAVGLVIADLDHDGDADLIVLKKDAPHDVFLNDRLWKYRKASGFDELLKSSVTAAVAADTDVDGQVELYTASQAGVSRWTPERKGVWRATALSTEAARTLAISDISGAGTLDLLRDADNAWAATSITDGKPLFTPANARTLTWTAAALDPEKGPAVIALSSTGPVLWNPGPGRHPFAALALAGKENKADQMRSNASGIGVILAARTGARWTASTTYRQTSGPGQSLAPVSLGLGGATKADFVSMTWPDGLRQTELDVPAGSLTKVAETQRQTSSCPVIFAWDGKQWAFVTDCLGVGGIGFAVAPGEYAPERPWENVLLPANLLQPKGDHLRLKLAEPMEEACYLDRAALVAYDLPTGWSMTLDERMGVNDPQPTGQPRFFRESITPVAASDDRGRDLTAALAKADHVAADPGDRDPRFVGFCREYAIAITFDRPIDATAGDPMLLIDGWIEYPYSQTMFAAWQAGVPYQAPTLEARGPDGKWVTLLDAFGYPAGMPRQMSVPIPRAKLPAGTRELRLRTNQEIYFDRIAVAWSLPCPEARVTTAPLSEANLAETGFAKRLDFPHHRPGYDYATRAPLWDAVHQDGFYTRFGRVDDLVRQTDDVLAIFGPGEEIELAFKAPSDAPQKWTRTWVLQLNGWCKDRDLYTKDGETLPPLPALSPDTRARRDEMHRQWNTRYRSGGGTR